MPTVTIVKWGNSMGIRIPTDIIQEAHLILGEKLKIVANKEGGVLLMPEHNLQEGWIEAFNAIADSQSEEFLIDLPNQFDEKEWTW